MLLSDCPASLPSPVDMSKLPAVPAALRYLPAAPRAAPARAALNDTVVPDAGSILFRRPCSKVLRSTLSYRGFSSSSSFCRGCRASKICFRVDIKLHAETKDLEHFAEHRLWGCQTCAQAANANNFKQSMRGFAGCVQHLQGSGTCPSRKGGQHPRASEPVYALTNMISMQHRTSLGDQAA